MNQPWPSPPKTELLPVVVQNTHTGVVLMLGYMNEEAYNKTMAEGRVTFFSRSKQRLWTKGETSENFLLLDSAHWDCDQDTLLVFAHPQGDTCHLERESCFGFERHQMQFLSQLESRIEERKNNPVKGSYTTKLFKKGPLKIAQKVGEEGVEVALASSQNDREEIIEESSDLMYHLLVLLKQHDLSLNEVVECLKKRNKED